MTDLVFDVTCATDHGSVTFRGVNGAIAAMFKRVGATIAPRKLLPCAQRPATARIATPSPAGPSPATGRGGDL